MDDDEDFATRVRREVRQHGGLPRENVFLELVKDLLTWFGMVVGVFALIAFTFYLALASICEFHLH